MLISNRCSELELQLHGCENELNISMSRFTLKGSDDKVTSMVQNALLTVVFGRQCIWVQFRGIHKTQDGRNSISDN